MFKKVLLLILMLCASVARADDGNLAGLQATVTEMGTSLRFVSWGDSWNAGAYYNGSFKDPGAGRPYTLTDAMTDPTASMGSELVNSLGWILKTIKRASIGQGSMEMMTDTELSTEVQSDNGSVYGCMTSQNVNQFAPHIIYLHGVSGYNDVVGGDDLQDLKDQAKILLKKTISVSGSAKWIVWTTWRPVGIYILTQQSGTLDQKLTAAIAQYAILDDFSDYCANDLYDEVAADGYDVSKVVIVDVSTAASAGVQTETTFERVLGVSLTTPQYESIDHIFWSPESWYKTDRVHLNDYGNRAFAAIIAEDVFGVTPSYTYTVGTGDTIYCDIQTGNNWVNRFKCNNRQYPLATIQAAFDQANPGCVIKVIGSGNQTVKAYDTNSSAYCSARKYELHMTKPGITILMEDDVYFDGLYLNGTADIPTGNNQEVGFGFFDVTGSSDGRAVSDSLSGWLAADWLAGNPYRDFDLLISGGRISGYQTPIYCKNYGGITLENMKVMGGNANSSIYLANIGQIVEFNMTDVTVYVDSSSVNSSLLGTVLLTVGDALVADVNVDDDTHYTGVWRGCSFIGQEGDATKAAIEGAYTGIKFIECLWEDLEVASRVIDGITNCDPWTDSQKTYFINCRWEIEDTGAGTVVAVYGGDVLTDSLFYVNCDFNLHGGIATANAHHEAAARGSGGVIYVAGTFFRHIEWAAGAGTSRDIVAANYAALAPNPTSGDSLIDGGGLGNTVDIVRRHYPSSVTMNQSATSDTMKWGGVWRFRGYDLESAFGVVHGEGHASIGPTQYIEGPTIALSDDIADAIPDYAESNFQRIAAMKSGLGVNTATAFAAPWPIMYPYQARYGTGAIKIKAPATGDPIGQANLSFLMSQWQMHYDGLQRAATDGISPSVPERALVLEFIE